MHTRPLRSALAAAVLLLSLTAVTVSAGGGAVIVPDDPQPPEPRAGEDIEYGFTVLQHGQTPAGWEDPTVSLTNLITGDSASFAATPSGRDGHFTATIRLEDGGLYSWTVTLTQLMVMDPPVNVTVLNRDGSRPVIDVAHAFTAIESVRRTLGMELREEFNGRIDQVNAGFNVLKNDDKRMRVELKDLTAERHTLSARVAELEGRAPAAEPARTVPLLGMLTLAVLAGALAGFAVAWLGTRRDPVQVEPVGARNPLTTA